MPRKEVLQKGNAPTTQVTGKQTRDFYMGNSKGGGIPKVEKALRDAEGDEYKKGHDSGDLDSSKDFDFFKKK